MPEGFALSPLPGKNDELDSDSWFISVPRWGAANRRHPEIDGVAVYRFMQPLECILALLPAI